MESCTLHGRLQDNNKGAARRKSIWVTSRDHMKGVQAICKVLIVVVSPGLAFLLISRDLANGTRCQDLVILLSKKFKERDGKHLVP